jgi:hypothetical protein
VLATCQADDRASLLEEHDMAIVVADFVEAP